MCHTPSVENANVDICGVHKYSENSIILVKPTKSSKRFQNLAFLHLEPKYFILLEDFTGSWCLEKIFKNRMRLVRGCDLCVGGHGTCPAVHTQSITDHSGQCLAVRRPHTIYSTVCLVLHGSKPCVPCVCVCVCVCECVRAHCQQLSLVKVDEPGKLTRMRIVVWVSALYPRVCPLVPGDHHISLKSFHNVLHA